MTRKEKVEAFADMLESHNQVWLYETHETGMTPKQIAEALRLLADRVEGKA